jgi:hypothetical protein
MTVSLAKEPAAAITAGSWTPSRRLLRRICRAYRLATSGTETDTSSAVWTMVGSKQTDLHHALLSDDDLAVSMLARPVATNLYYGVDNLAKDIGLPTNLDGQSDALISMFLTLAQAVGSQTVYNPHGGGKYPDLSRPPEPSIEEILTALDARLGTKVTFPNPFEGEVGIVTSRGVASYRAIAAIHQAIRSKEASCLSGNRLLEIGAGMGRSVYYASKGGLQCTIIDLPMTIVGQALFLSATLGEEAVWMLGDEAAKPGQIRLLTPPQMYKAGSFDVILNADSLTEMAQDVAESYVRFAAKHSKMLISINHEANLFTVQEISRNEPNLVCVSRSPYWLRDGYVEEVFMVKPTEHPSLIRRLLRS